MSVEGKLADAMELCQSILDDIELSRVPLTQIALRTSRLARIVGRVEEQGIFQYESSGYPENSFQLLKRVGRTYHQKDTKKPDGGTSEYGYRDSIDQLEVNLQAYQNNVNNAAHPFERNNFLAAINKFSGRISSRRSYIHAFVAEVYYELKFSSVAYDVFDRTRESVDKAVGAVVPEAVKKFTAIYENLGSSNTEDWSNAVHSCRRILQDTADAIYPARDDKIINPGPKQKTVKLGPDNYINRLVAYVEENSESARFNEIVGSHMKYLGERLDAIFAAAQKGSHDVIASQDEADRYVIYTYLVVGDILK